MHQTTNKTFLLDRQVDFGWIAFPVPFSHVNLKKSQQQIQPYQGALLQTPTVGPGQTPFSAAGQPHFASHTSQFFPPQHQQGQQQVQMNPLNVHC